MYGLTIGTVFGVAAGTVFGLFGDPILGLFTGVIVGLGFGLGAGIGHKSERNIKTVESLKWSWAQARFALVLGLLGALSGAF